MGAYPGNRTVTAASVPPDWHENVEQRSANRQSPQPAWSTFEEERRELLASIFQAIALRPPDADRTAACARLLRHLASLPTHC